MGVKNLWKILTPCGKRVPLEYKTLAVDTSIWMYQYRNLPTSLIIFSFCRRIFRILYSQIKPVFIFDGKPPIVKQNILEERKRANLKLLLRRYIANKKCEICNESLRNCKHINREDLEKLNEKAFEKMKTHDYNWGELSDEEEIDEFFEKSSAKSITSHLKDTMKRDTPEQIQNVDLNTSESLLTIKSIKEKANLNLKKSNANYFFDSSISNFDMKKLENLSKTEQLSMLIDLRLKRKLPMFCDNSTELAFCNSQIENVKKRNNITTLIKNLNKNADRIIRSDCNTQAILTKDREIFQNFYCIEDDGFKFADEEKKVEEAKGTTIEDLFAVYQSNNWEVEYEKYSKQSQKDYSIDQKIKYNQFLMKNLPQENSYSGLPSFEQKSLSTAEVLYNDLNNEDQSDVPEESSYDSCNFDLLDRYLLELSEEEIQVGGDSKEQKFQTKQEMAMLEANNDSDIKRVKTIFIEVLKIFELPYVESPGEADSQCWYLFKNGLIDGVVSEDSDMIIYGTTVYKNFFRKDKDILEFSLKEIEDKINLNKIDLIKLGYLLGCDYCEGQKGVGLKRAIEKINTVSDSEIAFLNEIYSNDTNIVKIESLNFGTLNKTKFNIFLSEKGVDKIKIDELMLYMKKIQELIN